MPELFRIKVQGFQVCRDYLDTFLSLLFVRFHFGQKKIHCLMLSWLMMLFQRISTLGRFPLVCFFVIEEEMNNAVLSRSASVCQFYLSEIVVLDRGQESWKEEDCDHMNDLCSFLQTFSPPAPWPHLPADPCCSHAAPHSWSCACAEISRRIFRRLSPFRYYLYF